MGDLLDNCPTVWNQDQRDSNGDGSGDACQPVIALGAIVQDGDGYLKVDAAISDPQHDILRGSIGLIEDFPTQRQFPAVPDCDAGFFPDGVRGEGVGGYFGLLVDLDSFAGCRDFQADFGVALGKCTEQSGPFQTVFSLSGLALPAPLCTRRLDGSGDGIDFTVVRTDSQSVTLEALFLNTAQTIPFEGALPRLSAIAPLVQGKTYSSSCASPMEPRLPSAPKACSCITGRPCCSSGIPPRESSRRPRHETGISWTLPNQDRRDPARRGGLSPLNDARSSERSRYRAGEGERPAGRRISAGAPACNPVATNRRKRGLKSARTKATAPKSR